MAKSKSFFGLRRGSTKSMTFQVLNGQQITKDRVSDVKNPRTQSQMVQRMVMTTAAAAYEHMKAICDHSFEGVSYGQRSMSRFMSLNAKALIESIKNDDAQYSFNPYGDSNLYAGAYIVSQGSMNMPNRQVGFEKGTVMWGIGVNTSLDDLGDQPWNDILKNYGLKLGDFMTLAFLYKQEQNDTWKFGWARLEVIATSEESPADVGIEELVRLTTNIQNVYPVASAEGLGITGSVGHVPMYEVYGAVIYSRKSNNVWKRSSAQIALPDDFVADPDAEYALATYPIGVDYILNGGNV